MSAKAAMLILQLVSNKEGRDGLRNILIILAAVLLTFVLLVAAVVEILMSPFALAGELGEFQDKYAYLIQKETVEYGEPLSEAEIDVLVAAATDDQDRAAVLQTALSLVGRVPYFWGGKSPVGWNEEWNTPKLVASPGVSSSGSVRPYGLDCSGFTEWVWETAGYQSIGVNTTAQFQGSTSIDEADLQPGDLAFKDVPSDEINHVGIYYGVDDTGKKMFIHCSSGAGGVVMDGYEGFHHFRRPLFLTKEE